MRKRTRKPEVSSSTPGHRSGGIRHARHAGGHQERRHDRNRDRPDGKCRRPLRAVQKRQQPGRQHGRPDERGREIHAADQGLILVRGFDARTNAATTITNTGAISSGVGNTASTASGNNRPPGIVLHVSSPTDGSSAGDATITNSGAVTVSGGYDGIRMTCHAHGDAMVGTAAGRLFGSVDVEQEFKGETRVEVSGSPRLEASAESTRFRLQAGGRRVWDEGRYSLQGSVGITAIGEDNRDLAGGLSFSMRF